MTDAAPLSFEDGRQSPQALRVRRGLLRFLAAQNCFGLPEVSLPTGRRADFMAVSPRGRVLIYEIKSSLADWQADSKWPDYMEWCDQLYFVCPPEMDVAVFPEQAGLIVADAYGAETLRLAPENPIASARRKRLTLLLARTGSMRMMAALDPAAPLAAGRL